MRKNIRKKWKIDIICIAKLIINIILKEKINNNTMRA